MSYSSVFDQIGFGQILAFYIIGTILGIAVKVFVLLAIGEDAKAIGVKNRVVFMVLAFFFPLITGIVYLCARKSLTKITPRMCMVCGQTMPPGAKYCFNCSSIALEDYKIADSEKHQKNRKMFLILAICFYVASFIFSITMGLSIATKLVKYIESHQNDRSGYSDYFGNYGGSGDFGDFDDFEDYFNNYGNNDFSDGFGEFSEGFGD